MNSKIKLSTIIIVIILINLFSNNAFSQRSFGSRLFFGGNLGLQFGSMTLIDVSPLIGYRLTEDVDLGVSLTYKYYKVKDYFQYGNSTFDFEANILGGGIFGRYHITENIFAHAEIEYLNFNQDNYYIYNNGIIKENENIGITSVFVGGGIKQEIGLNSFLTLMLLYNLNETVNSPYSNPVIRVGFAVGL